MSDEHEKQQGPTFRVGYRSATITLAMITLAAVASTVIVATIKNADVLSVVALALAIISFVIQIILFIVQQAAAAADSRRSNDLYAQTVKALASIEEKTQGTQDKVDLMQTQMLGYITKAGAEVAQATQDENAPAQEVIAKVAERAVELARQADAPRSAAASNGSNTLSMSAAEYIRRRRREEATSSSPKAGAPKRFFDKATFEKAAAALGEMSLLELRTLSWLYSDLITSRRSPEPHIGMRTINAAKTLYDKGIVVRKSVDWSPTPVFQLTKVGEAAGRLLRGPASLFGNDPRIEKAREIIHTADERMRASSDKTDREVSSVPIEDDDNSDD